MAIRYRITTMSSMDDIEKDFVEFVEAKLHEVRFVEFLFRFAHANGDEKTKYIVPEVTKIDNDDGKVSVDFCLIRNEESYVVHRETFDSMIAAKRNACLLLGDGRTVDGDGTFVDVNAWLELHGFKN